MKEGGVHVWETNGAERAFVLRRRIWAVKEGRSASRECPGEYRFKN